MQPLLTWIFKDSELQQTPTFADNLHYILQLLHT